MSIDFMQMMARRFRNSISLLVCLTTIRFLEPGVTYPVSLLFSGAQISPSMLEVSTTTTISRIT